MRHNSSLVRVLRLAIVTAVFVSVLPAVPAPAAGPAYKYWFDYAQSKVLPTTLPPTSARSSSDTTPGTLGLAAAQGEAEGRQLVIRAGVSAINDIWIQPSNLTAVDASGNVSSISASAISTYKVHYVRIRRPSYGNSRVGLEPDPLLPMRLANGQRLGWEPNGAPPTLSRRGASANANQPFYVLVTVPADAPEGTYEGTLTITAKTPDGSTVPPVAIPLRVKVYPFSVARRSLKTSFGLHMKAIAYANSASHKWLGVNSNPGPEATRVAERTNFKADQWNGWLTYFSDHRISPQVMLPAWENGSNWSPPADNGLMQTRPDYLNDYLGGGPAMTFSGQRFGFNTVKMPEVGTPSYVIQPFTNWSTYSSAAKYYQSMRSGLGPYYSRAYAYPIDEPSGSKRTFLERYAALVHKFAPGVKFFVTLDPARFSYKSVKGVDSYGHKLHFFFRDYSAWVKPLKRYGKQFWIYSTATTHQAKVPNFLIDEALPESRSQGWFAWRTRAAGLLYFNVNAWRPQMNSADYRDPYVDPLSFRGQVDGKWIYANGDGSLVYPGYYPNLGLHVEGSPPVGSLRMEALRDGLEDYEYLKEVKARFGMAAADAYVSRIIGPVPARQSGRLQFPAYSKSAWQYERVRADMAKRLSQ